MAVYNRTKVLVILLFCMFDAANASHPHESTQQQPRCSDFASLGNATTAPDNSFMLGAVKYSSSAPAAGHWAGITRTEAFAALESRFTIMNVQSYM